MTWGDVLIQSVEEAFSFLLEQPIKKTQKTRLLLCLFFLLSNQVGSECPALGWNSTRGHECCSRWGNKAFIALIGGETAQLARNKLQNIPRLPSGFLRTKSGEKRRRRDLDSAHLGQTIILITRRKVSFIEQHDSVLSPVLSNCAPPHRSWGEMEGNVITPRSIVGPVDNDTVTIHIICRLIRSRALFSLIQCFFPTEGRAWMSGDRGRKKRQLYAQV